MSVTPKFKNRVRPSPRDYYMNMSPTTFNFLMQYAAQRNQTVHTLLLFPQTRKAAVVVAFVALARIILSVGAQTSGRPRGNGGAHLDAAGL